ncbi:MAG: tetratricopeptide repeat protein [Candidatus Firestonebacteria bacterium]
MSLKAVIKCVVVFLILTVCNLCYSDDLGDPVARHYQKGLEYYKESLLDKAKAEWEIVLNINSEHKLTIEALNNLKLEIYKAEENDPFSKSICEFYEKGMKYYRCEEYEKAIKEFEQGLNLNSIQPQVKNFYNKCKEKIAGVNFSGESQAKVVDAESDVVKPENQSVTIKQVSRDKNKSRVSPKTKQDAKVQLSQAKTDKAKIAIDELYIQGLKSYQQGKYEDAVNAWEQVLALEPTNEKAKKNLKTVKNKIGRGK